MEVNYLQFTNLIGIGEAGLSFVNFAVTKGCIKKNCTVILNPHKSINKPMKGYKIFSKKSSAEVNYTTIAEAQCNQSKTIVVFGGAGNFSSDAAVRLNAALLLNAALKSLEEPISYIMIGPFRFEGIPRQNHANATRKRLNRLNQFCHYFSNQDIFSLVDSKASFETGFVKLNLKILELVNVEVLSDDPKNKIKIKNLRNENSKLNDRLTQSLAETEKQRKRGERDRRNSDRLTKSLTEAKNQHKHPDYNGTNPNIPWHALSEAKNQLKRLERDRKDAESYGSRKFAHDLLSVYDNMKRALEMATDVQRETNKSLFEGINLTQRDLINTFSKYHITPIKTKIGDKFNPDFHQAMFEAPMPTIKAGHILQVMDEGFMISNRLLRPASVGVSSGG